MQSERPLSVFAEAGGRRLSERWTGNAVRLEAAGLPLRRGGSGVSLCMSFGGVFGGVLGGTGGGCGGRRRAASKGLVGRFPSVSFLGVRGGSTAGGFGGRRSAALKRSSDRGIVAIHRDLTSE